MTPNNNNQKKITITARHSFLCLFFSQPTNTTSPFSAFCSVGFTYCSSPPLSLKKKKRNLSLFPGDTESERKQKIYLFRWAFSPEGVKFFVFFFFHFVLEAGNAFWCKVSLIPVHCFSSSYFSKSYNLWCHTYFFRSFTLGDDYLSFFFPFHKPISKRFFGMSHWVAESCL